MNAGSAVESDNVQPTAMRVDEASSSVVPDVLVLVVVPAAAAKKYRKRASELDNLAAAVSKHERYDCTRGMRCTEDPVAEPIIEPRSSPPPPGALLDRGVLPEGHAPRPSARGLQHWTMHWSRYGNLPQLAL